MKTEIRGATPTGNVMRGEMRSDESREPMFSVGGVTRFYVPLLLQGFSQSLAYPLPPELAPICVTATIYAALAIPGGSAAPRRSERR